MTKTAPRNALPWLLVCIVSACGDGRDEPGPGLPSAPPTTPAGDDGLPPGAKPFMVDDLRADLAAPRHASDGGGRAVITAGGEVRAGHAGSWTIVYTAGPEGIAVGGRVFLRVSPFWDWSEPQDERPDALGYTTVSTEAAGITLQVEPRMPLAPRPQSMIVTLGGRALEQGETVTFVYGAGSAGARADRYADRDTPIWILVDGDGDGVSGVVLDSPRIDVLPGPPDQLVIHATSRPRPGDAVRVTLAILDRMGNAGCELEGTVSLRWDPEGPLLPDLHLGPDDQGCLTTTIPGPPAGVARLVAEGPDGLTAESNPIEVTDRAAPILWGDLHGHSQLSDGTGTPEDYYRYARDVAGLDIAVLTDHDHWGMLALDRYPAQWERVRDATRAFHAPGRFVTLFGYEWTNWIHGHRHVLYFDEGGELLSSLDERYETPRQLWDALEGQDALTMAHHSAGGPIPTNWAEYPPDPVLEPVTEVVSVHGSSEAWDSPHRIYSPVPGNFVRDVLDQGQRLGFVGSGDSHDGHPGLAHFTSSTGIGGLMALLTDDCSRAGVLSAMRARRCYATSGPRILLDVQLDGHGMGSSLPAADEALLRVAVEGTAPLDQTTVVRSGQVIATEATRDRARNASLTWRLEDLRAGEYVYVRVLQRDGGAAWSSPIFID